MTKSVVIYSFLLLILQIPLSAQDLQELTKSAEEGNYDAMSELANIYLDEESVYGDLNKSFYWAEKAAQSEMPEAYRFLAYYYLYGWGVEADTKKATMYLDKASGMGLMDATWDLASLYYETIGDYELASVYLDRIAEQDTSQISSIGFIYLRADSLPDNINKAINLLSVAFLNGHTDDAIIIGLLYYKGDQVQKDIGKAIRYFKLAANKGNIDAMLWLSEAYSGIDNDKSNEWYKKVAENDYPEVQFELALRYLQGINIKESKLQAAYWFERASENNHPGAKFYLGTMLYNADGIKENKTRGVKLLLEAAESGVAGAQFAIGYFYYMGENFKVDLRKAAYYIKSAADQGDEYAMLFWGDHSEELSGLLD